MTAILDGRARRRQQTAAALEQAALELFGAKGYEATSVEEIADRAGVAPRTFFNYFATKDDVLFGTHDDRPRRLGELVRDAPKKLSTVDAVAHAFRQAAALYEGERENIALRNRAIESTPVLRGRSLELQRVWESSLAEGLVARGVDAGDAEVLAAVVVAVFATCMRRWLEDTRADLVGDITGSLERLQRTLGR